MLRTVFVEEKGRTIVKATLGSIVGFNRRNGRTMPTVKAGCQPCSKSTIQIALKFANIIDRLVTNSLLITIVIDRTWFT